MKEMIMPLKRGIRSEGSWSSICWWLFMNTKVPFDDRRSFPCSWMYHPFSLEYSILQ
jgi:hypothetical protein